jgi:hypothetical protein
LILILLFPERIDKIDPDRQRGAFSEKVGPVVLELCEIGPIVPGKSAFDILDQALNLRRTDLGGPPLSVDIIPDEKIGYEINVGNVQDRQ